MTDEKQAARLVQAAQELRALAAAIRAHEHALHDEAVQLSIEAWKLNDEAINLLSKS